MGAASEHEASIYWRVWHFHVLQEPGGRTSRSPPGDDVEAQGNKGLAQSHGSGQ